MFFVVEEKNVQRIIFGGNFLILLSAGVRQKVGNGVFNSLDLVSLSLGDFNAKFVFQAQHKLHCIQRIKTKIINEVRFGGHSIWIDFVEVLHNTKNSIFAVLLCESGSGRIAPSVFPILLNANCLACNERSGRGIESETSGGGRTSRSANAESKARQAVHL